MLSIKTNGNCNTKKRDMSGVSWQSKQQHQMMCTSPIQTDQTNHKYSTTMRGTVNKITAV